MSGRRNFHRYFHLGVLLLPLLGSISELLPSHHHHEGLHTCTQVDGTFHYLESIDGEEIEDASLRGMRLGDSHAHPECLLCKLSIFLNHSYLRTENLQLSDVTLVPTWEAHPLLYPRGPPPARGPPNLS